MLASGGARKKHAALKCRVIHAHPAHSTSLPTPHTAHAKGVRASMHPEVKHTRPGGRLASLGTETMKAHAWALLANGHADCPLPPVSPLHTAAAARLARLAG